MKNNLFSRLGLIVAAVIFLAGCSMCQSEKTSEIKVGVIMPLTGTYASFGQAVVQGMNLYKDTFEKKNPGCKLSLIVVDDRSTPEGAVAAYERLAGKDKVPVVVGAYTSANTFPLKPLSMRYKVPVVTPTATNDEITARNPYMFRTCYDDTSQGQALGRYAWKEAGIKKLGVLVCLDVDDGDYSRGLARNVADAFQASGGAEVKTVGYRIGQAGFIAQLQEFKAAGVDAVFAPLYPGDIVRLFADADKTGGDLLIFGSDSWSGEGLIEKIGQAGNGSFYSCMFSPQYQNPATAAFINLARERGLDAGLCLAQGYDTAGLLCSILSPESSADDVVSALAEVRNYPGVTGNISIFKGGKTTKNVFVEKIIWDKFNKRALRTLEYIIEPEQDEKK